MCSKKVDDKITLPKKRIRRSKRKCYSYNEKVHEVASYTNMKNKCLMSSTNRHNGN
jgi:hypothetical protein